MTNSDKEVLYAWERISFLLKGKEIVKIYADTSRR